MPTPILMPALSPTMESGTLAKWLKKEGDAVRSGDVIAEIETDKATMEVEAVDEGTLGKILVAEGTEDVAVNATIAMLLDEGEDESALEGAEAKGDGKKADAEAKEAPPPAPPPEGEGSKKAPEPEARKAPKDADQEAAKQPSAPAPSPRGGEGREGAGGSARAERKDGERIFASPLARRIARDKKIDLATLKGSGPHGRIVLKDVEGAKPGAPAEAPAAATAAPMADAAIRKFFEEGTYDVVPHDGMRKIVASRLLQATQTIPHFYLTMDCDIGTLLKVRQKLNDSAPKDSDGKPAWKLSVNDFIIKALGLALMRVPDANATWTEGGMLKHHQADVGVAVAVEGGLFTPVIRSAETRTLSQISNQMKDLAARARKRRLKPEEYQGGTTAVSNLGMYGVRDFDAVINPPHATILAVGAGEDRAVVVDGKVKVRTLMSVTLSCDHRVVDGALGAELLGAFKQFIEEPALMLV
jgi:pyruvate dehydrogenase E2 component (dihydrolipoamide acetyltransferase)